MLDTTQIIGGINLIILAQGIHNINLAQFQMVSHNIVLSRELMMSAFLAYLSIYPPEYI